MHIYLEIDCFIRCLERHLTFGERNTSYVPDDEPIHQRHVIWVGELGRNIHISANYTNGSMSGNSTRQAFVVYENVQDLIEVELQSFLAVEAVDEIVKKCRFSSSEV